MLPLNTLTTRLRGTISFFLLLTFSGVEAQESSFQMLGPVKVFGGEPPVRYSFSGQDVLVVEYGSTQGLFNVADGETDF